MSRIIREGQVCANANFRFLVVLLYLLVVALFSPRPAKAEDEAVFPSYSAEYAYRTIYSAKKKHKAFAIGPYGVYFFSWNFPSPKEAAKDAVRGCEKYAQSWFGDKELAGKCRLLAQGDKLLLESPWIGVEWQKPLSGPDEPLLRGKSSLIHASPVKGVILYLHGCDGLGWAGYSTFQGDYFNALGFDFFAPDSFAETRPAAVCGQYSRSVARAGTEIIKLRIAQAQRTLAGLKLKYPDKPIFIWGHSEGGGVAKLLDVDVSGIIASGDECNVAGLRIAAPASVPILFMFGENDAFVEGFKLPLTTKKMQKCRDYVRNKKTKIAVIKNNKHDIFPWREDVAKAISSFIGAASTGLPKEQPTREIALNDQQLSQLTGYAGARSHRAFAAGVQRAASWSDNWEFVEDARKHALYNCATNAMLNMFALAEQPCIVQNVDGENVAKQ